MPVILLRPKKINPKPNGRPANCPHCGSAVFQRWGEVTKPIKDQLDLNIKIYRYRCEACRRTFRDYPEGIDPSDYTQSTKQIAALIWALGYSYRDIVDLFKTYGITLSLSTIWREGKALADRLDGIEFQHHRQMYTIDQQYIHRISPNFGVVIAVDIGGGRVAILGTIDEHNPRSVQAWLKPLVQDAEIDYFQLETGKLDLIFKSRRLTTGQLLA